VLHNPGYGGEHRRCDLVSVIARLRQPNLAMLRLDEDHVWEPKRIDDVRQRRCLSRRRCPGCYKRHCRAEVRRPGATVILDRVGDDLRIQGPK
jgi:hypothetical protein